MSAQPSKTPDPPSLDGAIGSIEQGTWLYYDQASIATRKSEKTLKRYVKQGKLKWRRMGKQPNSPIQVWITADLVATISGETDQTVEDPDIFDAISSEVEGPHTSEETYEAPSEHSSDDDSMQRMIKMLVAEFGSHVSAQQAVMLELEKELEEKKAQLRLLPDLQKQLEAREREASEKTAALEEELRVAKKLSLEKERIVADLETEKKQKSDELEALQAEQEKYFQSLQELQTENEQLRESIGAKKSWWKWFTGQS